MKIQDIPFTTTVWRDVAPVEYLGVTGSASWRTVEAGNLRLRMVDYSPAFLQDHWCARGHVILVLQGELVVELGDGRTVKLVAGESFHVADDASSHRLSSGPGAIVFVVD
ncbi:MAG: DHCW motif cupin fold protein [Burkholderiales bacterium]|nr:DHCW motif cupin fold protein [Burkholderiales bacterium]